MIKKQFYMVCLTLIFAALLAACGAQPQATVDTSAIDAANAAKATAEANAAEAEAALAEAEAAAKEAAQEATDAGAEELESVKATAEAAQAEAEAAQAEVEAAKAEAEAAKAEAEAAQAEAAAQPEVEKTKIVWLACCGWPTDVVEAEFEKQNPDIDLEVENVGFNELFQQIQIRLGAEDDTPDVVTVDGPVVASYGLRDWLMPLDDVFTQREINDWLGSSYDAGHYDGKLIGAPLSTSTQMLFYNKDLLDAAGVTPPGPDERWTWEQVAEAAQQVKEANPDVQAFNWEQMVRIYQLQPLPMSLGGQAIGEDGLTVDGVINSQEWIDAFTFYWKVYNEWGLAPQGEIYWAPDAFEAGDLAFVVAGPWNIRRFAEADIDFEWGVSRHPYFEGGEVIIPTGGWHLGINKNSNQKEAAARYIKWLTTGEGAEMWWRYGAGDFPAQESVLELFQSEPEFDEGPLSAMRTAADEAGVNPVPRPLTVGYLEYEQILQDTFQDIRNGTDPEEALNTAVDRIEREMQKYK